MSHGGFHFGSANSKYEDDAGPLKAFEKTFLNHLSLGLLDTRHPVYDDEYIARNEAASMAGTIAGEVGSFAALAGALKGVGLTAKAAQLATKSGAGGATMRLIGKLPELLGRSGSWFKPLQKLSNEVRILEPRFSTLEAASGVTATNMTARALQNSIYNTVTRFEREDKQKPTDYLREIALPVRDFLLGAAQGYGITAINSPQSWGLRAVGDGLYSTAMELQEAVINPDYKWDGDRFIQNYLIGAIIGEAQNKIFDRYRKILPDTPERVQARAAVDKATEGLPLPDEARLRAAEAVLMAAKAENARINPKAPGQASPEQIKKYTDKIVIPLSDDRILSLINAKNFPDLYEVRPEDFSRIVDVGTDNAYKRIVDYFPTVTGKDLEYFKSVDLLNQRPEDIQRILKNRGFTAKEEVVKEAVQIPLILPTKYEALFSEVDGYVKKLYGKGLKDVFKDRQEYFNQKKAEALADIEAEEGPVKPSKKVDVDPADIPIANDMRRVFETMAIHEKVEKVISNKLGGKNQHQVLPIASDIANDIRNKSLSFFLETFPDRAQFVKDLPLFNKGDISGFLKTPTGKIIGSKLSGFINILTKRVNAGQEHWGIRESPTEKISAEGEIENVIDNVAFSRYKEDLLSDVIVDSINEKSGAQNVFSRSHKEGMVNTALIDYLRQSRKRDFPSKLNSVIAYLMNKRDRLPYQAIAEIFNDVGLRARGGVKFKDTTIGDNLERITKSVKQMLNAGNIRERIVIKPRYTEEELGKVVQRMQEERPTVNKNTGLENDVNAYVQKKIEEDGAWVLNVSAERGKIIARFGQNIGDMYLSKMGELIARMTSRFNGVLRKQKSDARVGVKNPDDDTFILYADKMDPTQFKRFASYVERKLSGNFEETADPFNKFAIKIKAPSGEYFLLTGFGDITTFYTRDVADLARLTTISDMLRKSVREVPELQGKFADAYIDLSKPTIKNEIDGLALEWQDPAKRQSVIDRLGRLVEGMEYKSFVDPIEFEALKTAKSNMTMASLEESIRGKNAGADEERAFDTLREVVKSDSIQLPQTKAFSDTVKVGQEKWGSATKPDLEVEPDPRQSDRIRNWMRKRIDEFLLWRRHKASVSEGVEKTAQGQKYLAWLYGEESSRAKVREIHSPTFVREQGGWDMIMNVFRDKRGHIDYQRAQAFQSLFPFIKEQEAGHIIFKYGQRDNKGNLAVRLTPESSVWQEPIKYKPNHGEQDLKDILSKRKLDSASIRLIYDQIIDPDPKAIPFSKIAVQHLGVPAEDLINFMLMNEKNVAQFIRGSRFAGELGGELKDYTFFKELKDRTEQSLKVKLARYFDPARWLGKTEDFYHNGRRYTFIDFDDPKARDYLTTIAQSLPREANPARVKAVIDMFYEMDIQNLSYNGHRVLADPVNKKTFVGEMNDYLSGKETKGQKLLSPIMNEMMGRKFARMIDLIRAGYDVETNGYKLDIAQTGYVLNKLHNRDLAENFKKQLLDDFKTKYNLYKESGDDTHLLQYLADNSGIIYVPTSTDFLKLHSLAKKINEAAKNVRRQMSQTDLLEYAEMAKSPDVQAGYSKYGDTLSIKMLRYSASMIDIRNRLVWMNRLLKFWNGELLTEGQAMKPDMRRAIAEKWSRGVTDSLISNRDNSYIPMNKKAHDENTKTKGLQYLMSKMQTRMAEDNIRAPSIPDWEGLYAHRLVHKGLAQHIFRLDLGAERSPYEFINFLKNKIYVPVNTFLKTLPLVNSFLLANYNMQQALRGDPNALNPKNMIWGFWAWLKRHDPKSEYGKLYWRASNQDVFSRSVGSEGQFISDAARSYTEMMGLNPYVQRFSELWSGDKNFFKKVGTSLYYGWKTNQDFTWALDSMMRLSMFKSLEDRFTGAGYNQQDASFRAGYMTNLWMAHYARLPHATRRMLNLFMSYPTYRIQNYRTELKMLEMAARSLGLITDRHPVKGIQQKAMDAGFIPRGDKVDPEADLIRMYPNRFREAFYEMGPLVRSFALKQMMKLMGFALFGFGYENVFDVGVGYRTRREKGEGNWLDNEIQFLSFMGPAFELDKIFTRPWQTTVLNNTAMFPGLIISLLLNRNVYTGRPVGTVDWKKEPQKFAQQWTTELIRTYFPMGRTLLPQQDYTVIEQLINASGLGLVYSTETPRILISKLERAADESNTLKERLDAQRDFQKSMGRLYYQLFNQKYKHIAQDTQELYENYLYGEAKRTGTP